ncbi:MAG: threonylcarbamoyl-AMP synthase [Clostridiales bacterium]|nr:threonylcarbamoyl-AMP synthase [Clostridiales bacterium]
MIDTQLLMPTEESIQLAAQLLERGQLVGFPTETVYGLGANALDPEAALSIFAAKGRPADNPLIVHVAEPEQLEPLCHVNSTALKLMDVFCPGPLTMILPKKEIVPMEVTAGLNSVAVRIPSHPVARAMLKACKLPIAAPSANTSGKPSPTSAKHVMDDLKGKLPLILDGGECEVGLESTVLDLTSSVPTILRPGGVTPEMLLTVLEEVRIADSILRPLQEGEKALSPGMRYKHYAPTGKLTMVRGRPENVAGCIRRHTEAAKAQGQKVRILAFDEHRDMYSGLESVSIGSLNQPQCAAQKLFSILRSADDDSIPLLFSETLPASGIGLAFMNRLCRAAGFNEIDADAGEE